MSVDWPNQTVLVTGGAGFIGSFLVEQLAETGADVVVADNFSRSIRTRMEHLIRSDQIAVRPLDLTTYKGCIEATEGADHVFHLAATVGGIHYIKRENVEGLTPSVLMNQHMLEAARVNGIGRLLFASSACVYRQDNEDLTLFSEDQAIPANPHSTYGWAKILGEVACNAYQTDTALTTSSVRIFNCYGPRENLDPQRSHVVPAVCRKVIEEPDGGSIELFGDGKQERGFIYVTDLVEGMVRTVERKTDGEAINLGNSTEVVTMTELAERIIDISGKDISIEYDRSKPTGTDKYACDMTRMTEELDWTPDVTLDDGLRRVYDWAASKLNQPAETVTIDGGDFT